MIRCYTPKHNGIWAYLAIFAVGFALAFFVYYKSQNDYEIALEHYQNESLHKSRMVAHHITDSFNQLYQGLLAISLLPDIKNISNDSFIIEEGPSSAISQIYYNMRETNLLTEVHIASVNFHPDAPKSSVYTVGGHVKPGQHTQVKEIQLYDHQRMYEHVSYFLEHYPDTTYIQSDLPPIIGGKEVVLCEDIQSGVSDRLHCKGMVFSVPFYGNDGQLKGIITAISLNASILNLIPQVHYPSLEGVQSYYTIVNKAYDYYLTFNQTDIPSEASVLDIHDSLDLLFSTTIPIHTQDPQSEWLLLASYPNEVFLKGDFIQAMKNFRFVGYGLAALFVISSTIVIALMRHYILNLHEVNCLAEKRAFEAETLAKELQYNESRMHAIADNTIDGIITFDDGHVIRSYNSACEKMFGYKAKDIIGKDIKILMPTSYYESLDTLLFRPESSQKIVNERIDAEGMRKDKTIFPMYLGVNETILDDKRFFTIVVRDITKQKEIEYNLLKAKEEAEKISQHKADFLSNMSHELRTPLNGIFGMVELLANTDLNDQQKKYIGILDETSQMLLSLIEDILNLSRIESGTLSVTNAPFSITQHIESIHMLMSSSVEKKGLDFFVNISSKVPEHVIGDAGKIRQTLINLISNAVKFTDEGHVEIVVDATVRQKKAKLTFSVVDTGIGIPKDKQDIIFERFEQADSSSIRSVGGSGLGLAICKNLVEMMGGELGVTSTEGKGSSFWFSLSLPLSETG